MTAANLLARLRTLLDEASASYWTDAECYNALADGQRELINNFIRIFQSGGKVDLPNVLRVLLKNKSNSSLINGATSDTLPTDFIIPLTVRYNYTNTGSKVACLIRTENGRYRKAGNSYLASSATNPFVYFDAANINFETAVSVVTGNGSYDYDYIALPADIASGQNPTLPDSCAEPIAQFAFGLLLQKDQRAAEASEVFNRFYQTLPGLYQ